MGKASERRFTEVEVREILERATDDNVTPASPLGEGLSLAELKGIGEDVGIDSGRIEEAARAIARGDELGSDWTAGFPDVLRYERVVDGDVVPSRRAQVLSTIRRAMGHSGDVFEAGGSLEWHSEDDGVQRLVVISSTTGRTTIEGSTSVRKAVVRTYLSVGPVAGTLGGLGVAASLGSPEINVLGLVLSLGFLGAALVGLRVFVRRLIRTETAKLERTVEELEKLTAERPD